VKSFLSLLIYRVFLFLLLPILLALLLLRSRNHPEYRQRLLERLGCLPRHFKTGGIVVHAASVGEVIALKAFIDKLLLTYPKLPITITTFTPTGSIQVIKLFGERVQHCYLPLDIVFCSHLFIRTLKPKAMVFMETELWPNLIAQLSTAKVKLLLINARLSQHSMKNYQKLSWLITPCINTFDQILCQSTDNIENFFSLGCDKERCLLSGNLKFDISINKNILEKQQELSQFIPTDRPIWLMASTHQGDEALALQAYKKLQETQPDLLLIIVPRHPERFEQVANLCATQALKVIKRSDEVKVKAEHQIWLLDSLGELMAAFALSDIVTMGGSFSTVGGHNPLEPALFKKPVIVGSDMTNFTEILTQLLDVQGIKQLASNTPDKLAQAINNLLLNKVQQTILGDNAYQVVLANQGASEKSVQQLQSLLGA